MDSWNVGENTLTPGFEMVTQISFFFVNIWWIEYHDNTIWSIFFFKQAVNLGENEEINGVKSTLDWVSNLLSYWWSSLFIGKVFTRLMAHNPEFNQVSVAWSDWEYYYSPLDGMLVHRKVTPLPSPPQHYVAGTHLYTWVERDKVVQSFLSKDMMEETGFKPPTFRLKVRHANH